MLEAVIFDLFGTLIWLPRNSRPYWRLARAAPSLSLRTSLVVDAPTLADYCQLLHHPEPPELTGLQSGLEADIAAATLFEDSLAAVRKVRESGLKTGLISNLATPYVQAYFNLGLHSFFDTAVFSCEVGFAKPAAEIYQLALKQLHVAPERTLMIGDSQRCDVDGPAGCGIRGLLLERDPAEPAKGCIQSLLEIDQHIDS